jgi:hypothetical protein
MVTMMERQLSSQSEIGGKIGSPEVYDNDDDGDDAYGEKAFYG